MSFTIAEMVENKKYSAESRVDLMLTMGTNEISVANLFYKLAFKSGYGKQKSVAKQRLLHFDLWLEEISEVNLSESINKSP